MSRKRKCRYTPEELALHKEAVRPRERMRGRGNVPLLAPLRRCDVLALLLRCGRGRRRGLPQRGLVVWLRAGV